MRASEADREQAAEVLKVAFIERRLAKDEFDLRVGWALAALTYADLDMLTADIPVASPPHPQPVAVRARRRDPKRRASDHRQTRALAVIAQAAWAQRRLISILAGLLLLGAGLVLASPVAFIAGVLVVGASAPRGLASSSEAATVRMWQRQHRAVRLAVAVPAGVEPRRSDRLVFAVRRDQQPGSEVQRHARASEHGQRRDDDADQRDIHVDVAGDAAGHAGRHPVVAGPAQLPDFGLVINGGGPGACGCCAHDSRLPSAAAAVDRDQPGFAP
jgi:hypothetical protein